jgi:integrase
MAIVNFYLKDPKAEKATPINLVFSYGAKAQLKYATGTKVEPANWSFDKQHIREKRGVADAVQRNAFLKKIDAAITSIYHRLLNEGEEIDNDSLKYHLDVELKRRAAKKEMNFMEYMEYICKLKKDVKSSDRSIVGAVVNNIKLFCKAKKRKLDFKDLTISFRDEFNAFLEGKDYKQNSISTYFRALKIILAQAQDDGLNPFNYFRSRKFSAFSERVKRPAFTIEELLKLHQLDLRRHPKSYADVRDIFLIGAFSVMRVSDYNGLDASNFQNGFIHKKTKKTGKQVVVPMHWVVKEILDKRKGVPPRKYADLTINRVIKKVAEIAEIDQPTLLTYTKGGKQVEEIVPKSQLATSHKARRSGATTMLEAGIDREKVMILGGWESESSFVRYLDIKEEKNAEELSSHEFFTNAAISVKKTKKGIASSTLRN